MTLLTASTWEIVAGLAVVVLVAAALVWLFLRPRPTPDELERLRRKLLSQSGRLVDGMLLDVREMETADGCTLTLLEFSYRIGGVEYECSQDITSLKDVVDPAQVQAGFPCSVRYQTGSPQNSIVLAEEWSGLRHSLPVVQVDDAARQKN
jgi:hypothetical protein